MEKFRELGINEKILEVIKELSFTEPSEIQQKAIPLALQGKDIIGGSATGSGKTLAFGASIIEHVNHGQGLQALILVPTRELAEQVCQSLNKFSKYKPLTIIPVYGGVSINPQIFELRKADVVVGTPGRILDHMSRKTIDLSKIKILVLDEADRMLDMGFIDDVQTILQNCPKHRQTMLFSATIYEEIVKLSQRYMHDPVQISVESYVDPSKLRQIFYDVKPNLKLSLLVHLLNQEKSDLVMVFCNTRHIADVLTRNLSSAGIQAVAIHGGLSQNKRQNVLNMFHKGKVGVLVCTDVAARGLDIPNVTHVYNYDVPGDSKNYIHRIGRTARAGKEGIAISIVCSKDYENFQHVLADRSLNIMQEELPAFEEIHLQREERGRGGFSHGPRRYSHGDGNRGYGGGFRQERSEYRERDDYSAPVFGGKGRTERSESSHGYRPRFKHGGGNRPGRSFRGGQSSGNRRNRN